MGFVFVEEAVFYFAASFFGAWAEDFEEGAEDEFFEECDDQYE